MSKAERQTLDYYDRHAGQHARRTSDVDLGETWEEFLRRVPAGGKILDAGCGSGRDTLFFSSEGYRVTAIDASEGYAADTRRRTGIPVRVLRVQEIDFDTEFDGIWASASLLHVPRPDLARVLGRLALALVPGGVLYLSMKYGTRERFDELGRYFNDMDEEALSRVAVEVPGLKIEKVWVTAGVPNPDQQWLNGLLIRTE